MNILKNNFKTVFVFMQLLVIGAIISGESMNVRLDGYEHGVAICEGGGDDAMMHQDGEFHMWKKDGIFFLISEGHINDPQVKQLEAHATSECHKMWY